MLPGLMLERPEKARRDLREVFKGLMKVMEAIRRPCPRRYIVVSLNELPFLPKTFQRPFEVLQNFLLKSVRMALKFG